MRRWFWVLLLVLVGVVAIWIARETLLNSLGRFIVEENPPERVDLGVIIMSDPVPGTEEMARLVKDGYVPHVVIFISRDTTDEVLDRLHIAAPRPHDVAVLVLRRLGVPAEAIAIEQAEDNGTNAAVRALTQYMRQRHLTRVTVVADRSHTRRIARLLRARLGPAGFVIVRAAPADPYHPERWWKDRSSSRELVDEWLRWFNSFVLGDWWRQSSRVSPPHTSRTAGWRGCGVPWVAAPAGTGVLDARWTAPTSNVDGSPLTDLASYCVYYGTSEPPCPGFSFFRVPSPTPRTAANRTIIFRLTGLSKGTRYYVSATALNTRGLESACSTPASAIAR
jgi:hypothetical protein